MRKVRDFILILLLPVFSDAVPDAHCTPLYFQNKQVLSSEVVLRFNKAVELQRKGDLQGAEVEYRAVLSEAPNYAEAHANLGAVLIRLDRYEEAVRSYELALKLAPNLSPILLNLGIAHFRNAEFEKAIAAFQQFLEASPAHSQATHLMGLSLVELGRDEEALKYLDQALENTPNDPALLYATGLVCLRQEKPYLSAIIKSLSEVPGGLAASRLLRGQQLLKRFEFEKAVEELEAAAKLNSDLPRVQYSMGLAYYKLGRTKEASTAFEAELRRSPKDFSTLYYSAYFREESGDLAGAHKNIDLALAIDAESPEANALLGKIFFKEGKAAEAVKPLEFAVAKEPADPDRRYLLGRVYLQLGRKEDAVREINESKRLRAEQVEKDRIKPL
jgi:tetratricopeptide (TPR) repeat protein